jgi:hypothetical protein
MSTTPKTTPLTYNGYVTQIATMAVVGYQTVTNSSSNQIVVGVDPAFNAIIPQMLNYAELRIQRDLDLLPSSTVNTAYSLTTGNNQISISSNDFVTVQTISITDGTAKIPLLPSSKEFLQNVYNDSSVTGEPAYFAMFGGDAATGGNTSNNIIVGPYPDANYPLTITGTVRLQTLYPTLGVDGYPTTGVGTTFISTNLPDMLIMASMIYISAFQRNFGRESDDPAMAQSYEAQYQVLKQGAIPEEFRKKFEGSAWSSDSVSPAATPTR